LSCRASISIRSRSSFSCLRRAASASARSFSSCSFVFFLTGGASGCFPLLDRPRGAASDEPAVHQVRFQVRSRSGLCPCGLCRMGTRQGPVFEPGLVVEPGLDLAPPFEAPGLAAAPPGFGAAPPLACCILMSKSSGLGGLSPAGLCPAMNHRPQGGPALTNGSAVLSC
jgi:hypothetical protein